MIGHAKYYSLHWGAQRFARSLMFCTVLHSPALSSMSCIVLHCPALSCFVMHCPACLALSCIVQHVLHCPALSCVVLNCPTLSCIVLHCPGFPALSYIVLHCTALSCIALPCPACLVLSCTSFGQHCVSSLLPFLSCQRGKDKTPLFIFILLYGKKPKNGFEYADFVCSIQWRRATLNWYKPFCHIRYFKNFDKNLQN